MSLKLYLLSLLFGTCIYRLYEAYVTEQTIIGWVFATVLTTAITILEWNSLQQRVTGS